MADQPNPSPLLTEKEFKALDLCNALADILGEIVADGAKAEGGPDEALNQLVWSQFLNPHISTLRAYIKAQAAARAYPGDGRVSLMGQ